MGDGTGDDATCEDPDEQPGDNLSDDTPAPKGRISCGTTVVAPIAKLAAARTPNVGLAPAMPRAIATATRSSAISRRRSVMSPRGTKSTNPAA